MVDVWIGFSLWYAVLQQTTPLVLMSDQRLFGVPLIGNVARRLGLKVSSIDTMTACLRAGNWVGLPPGGNTDQLRSIWHRTHTRMYKLQYRNGVYVPKPQTWFVFAAAQLNVKAYPLVFSGVHEITPILWESKFLFRFTGMYKLRGGEYWPGFPVSLNHFINLFVFYLTGWMDSVVAWMLFLVTNIYIDMFYSYPIFFPKVRVQCGHPILLGYPSGQLSMKQRKEENLKMLKALNDEANRCLQELDDQRPFMRHLPRFKERFV